MEMEHLTNKITFGHLKRRAALYIRQSTMQQVLENTESTRRQYELKDRLIGLGWPMDRIDVIDSDIGLSGADASRRDGFKRLLADVGNGEIGAVACIECSRLSRKQQDWGYLLEICAITNTLLIDADGIYDPNDFNDGILLGLKGTMSAAELHFIKARMRGGALSRANRGEYRVPLPVGYIYDECGAVKKDPNLEVQNAIRMLFNGFRTFGTVRRMVQHFKQNGFKFPKNPGNGFYNNEIVWDNLCTSRAYQVLKNRVYAGTYSYGKHQVVRTVDGRKIRPKQPDEWHVCIDGHHEGYISLDEYEQNIAQLTKNRIMRGETGPALQGPALLQGIVLCGKCGDRMHTFYQHQSGKIVQYYCCRRDLDEFGGSACQAIHGIAVDRALSDIILDKLTPTAILNAIEVQKEIERRDASSGNYYAMRVESSRYKAELARKRFSNVDPENRLVAFELERLWNRSLEELALAEDEQRRNALSKERPTVAKNAESLLALPEDVKTLWNSENINIADKKRIVRCIVENVTLLKDGKTIHIGVLFKTGSTSEVKVANPLPVYEKNVLAESTLDVMRREAETHNSGEIAKTLNGMGLKSACGLEFSARIVEKSMRSHGIPTCEKRLAQLGYITLPEKAMLLDIPWQHLYHKVVSGKYDGVYTRAGERGKFMFK
jgi:DNA invertase Pin-like site-specific DNA recombinase